MIPLQQAVARPSRRTSVYCAPGSVARLNDEGIGLAAVHLTFIDLSAILSLHRLPAGPNGAGLVDGAANHGKLAFVVSSMMSKGVA